MIEANMEVENRDKTGLPPGTPVFTGEFISRSTAITVIRYNPSGYDSKQFSNYDKAIEFIANYHGVVWINIDSVHDVQLVQNICKHFNLHKLTIEDILNVKQRPKMEDHSHYVYAVIKMIQIENEALSEEQVSLILHGNLVISFQEKKGDVFDVIRRRIQKSHGYIRDKESDYLVYALLDAIVDNYFSIMEMVSDKLDNLETVLLESNDRSVLHSVHLLRRDLRLIRRAIYPARDLISRMDSLTGTFFQNSNRIFIRDLYDHAIRIVDTLELLRETASGLLDLYMNSISNRMNEVMKILTIIATIFIPLTFIVGVYGMNFVYMPELGWRYGYLAVWGIMVTVCAVMVYFFKKNKWL